MKITLAEARLILDNKEAELKTLFQRRKDCRLNIYKKNEDKKELLHEEHEFTVDDLTKDIERLKKEIRKLRLVTTKANIDSNVDFTVDGEKISLQEAIYLIKQYREELPVLKDMGEIKTTSTIVDPTPRYGQSTVDRSYEQLTEPTYNTKEYRKKAEKLEFLITKLEIAINQANYNTTVEIEGLSGVEEE
jgi:HD superfamily phosphohydrolase